MIKVVLYKGRNSRTGEVNLRFRVQDGKELDMLFDTVWYRVAPCGHRCCIADLLEASEYFYQVDAETLQREYAEG